MLLKLIHHKFQNLKLKTNQSKRVLFALLPFYPSRLPGAHDVYKVVPTDTMTIYDRSSESYWKAQRKKHGKKLRLKLTIMMIGNFLLVAGAIIRRSGFFSSGRPFAQRRNPDQTTEMDWKQCESRVNPQEECATICLPERNSIQRKTMHQACLHGQTVLHGKVSTYCCAGITGHGRRLGNSTLEMKTSTKVVDMRGA